MWWMASTAHNIDLCVSLAILRRGRYICAGGGGGGEGGREGLVGAMHVCVCMYRTGPRSVLLLLCIVWYVVCIGIVPAAGMWLVASRVLVCGSLMILID